MLATCLQRQATVLHVLSLTLRREFFHRPPVPSFLSQSQPYSSQPGAQLPTPGGEGSNDASEAGFWGDVLPSPVSHPVYQRQPRRSVREAGEEEAIFPTGTIVADPLTLTDPLQYCVAGVGQPRSTPTTSTTSSTPDAHLMAKLDGVLKQWLPRKELYESLRQFIRELPPRPSSVPGLVDRVHLLRRVSYHFFSPYPQHNTVGYHNHLQILWSEIMEIVRELQARGCVELVLENGQTKGLHLKSFDRIISSYVQHPPEHNDTHWKLNQGAWKRSSLEKTVELVLSLFDSLSMRQFDAVLRYYALYEPPTSPQAVREARRRPDAREAQIAEVRKRWEKRKSLVTTLERVLAERNERKSDIGRLKKVDVDSEQARTDLQFSLYRVCSACLSDIARLGIGDTADTRSLVKDAYFWRARRDTIVSACQERLSRPDGLMSRWVSFVARGGVGPDSDSTTAERNSSMGSRGDAAGEPPGSGAEPLQRGRSVGGLPRPPRDEATPNTNVVVPTYVEERSIKLLLSDAIRQDGIPSVPPPPVLNAGHIHRLDDPLDLLRLYFGVSRQQPRAPVQRKDKGAGEKHLSGAIFAVRNHFYNKKSFSSVCELVEVLLGVPKADPEGSWSMHKSAATMTPMPVTASTSTSTSTPTPTKPSTSMPTKPSTSTSAVGVPTTRHRLPTYPIPAPPLDGKVLAGILLTARDPDQFAYLLVLLLRLPRPRSYAVIDQPTRRMLRHFAFYASAPPRRTANLLLVPPDDPLRPLLVKEGFMGLLRHAYRFWGVGVPDTVFRADREGRTSRSGLDAQALRRRYAMSRRTPKLLSQHTDSAHFS